MPEWGSLDILEACGASDPGSNPGPGIFLHSAGARLQNPLEFKGAVNSGIFNAPEKVIDNLLLYLQPLEASYLFKYILVEVDHTL